MSLISLPNTFSNGTTADASQVNSNFTTIYNDHNGNLTDANVASGAAIAASKLNLSAIAQTVGYSGAAENWAQASNLVSASTVNIGAAAGNYAFITGTTTITAFDTIQAGTPRFIKFSGILTLTHNATSLILPNGGSNITTAAGDTAIFVSEGSGNWRCLMYQKASGGVSFAVKSDQTTATSTTVSVNPGVQQYHPSASKAWCIFNGATTGTNAPTAGYNVTSVTRNGTGDYTITFTVAFTTANYCVSGMTSRNDTGGAAFVGFYTSTPLATGTARVITYNDAGAAADGNPVSLVFFGTQ